MPDISLRARWVPMGTFSEWRACLGRADFDNPLNTRDAVSIANPVERVGPFEKAQFFGFSF